MTIAELCNANCNVWLKALGTLNNQLGMSTLLEHRKYSLFSKSLRRMRSYSRNENGISSIAVFDCVVLRSLY